MILDDYKIILSHLSVKITNERKAPNKAVMLISIMDLIRLGYIKENRIYLDKAIEDSFRRNWSIFFPEVPLPNPWTPFWHLKNELFWHFKSLVNDAYLEALVSPGQTLSVGKMREAILYAYLDDDLFDLMNKKKERDVLIELLLETYVKNGKC